MRKVMQYAKPYTGYMLITLLLKFVAAMMDLLIPSFLAKIIDETVPTGNVRLILVWGGVMAACAVVSVTTNVTANRMAEVSAGRMTRKLRYDLFQRVSYLSAAQMDEFTVPSMISRLTSDTYNVNRMLARMQRLGVRGPILLLGGILVTMTMEPKLTLVLVSALPVILLLVWLITARSVPVYDKQQTYLDDMVRVLRENITGVRVIRALSRTAYEKTRYDKVNERLSETEQRAGSISAASNPATTLVLNLGLTAVVITGAFLVQKGEAGPGAIIAFLSYFTIILNAMLGITRIFMMCSKGVASARRIATVLEAPEDLPVFSEEEIQNKAGETEVAEEAHIAFCDVSFSYLHRKNNIEHVSFSLKKGETLGVIGATGSGKTTLIQLLLRFYDVDSGRILFKGRDVRTIPLRELREHFGVVFQNDFLMADSLESNIDYFRGLSEERIEKAAEYAQAEAFIREKKETGKMKWQCGEII